MSQAAKCITADRARVAQGAAHGVDVADVALDERRTERRLAMTGRQVVVDDGPVAGPAQRLGGVAADVAGATGHQHRARVSGGQWSSR